jgi:hypothetical protein
VTRKIRYCWKNINGFATSEVSVNTLQIIGLRERMSEVNLIYSFYPLSEESRCVVNGGSSK